MSTSALIAPTLRRNDTPIICTCRQRQSQPVRCAGPSNSLPRPKRARVYRRYLRPCSGQGHALGMGEEDVHADLLVTTALFILAMPQLGRRGYFGLRAVPHEARRKTGMLSLSCLLYLCFFLLLVISIHRPYSRKRDCGMIARWRRYSSRRGSAAYTSWSMDH